MNVFLINMTDIFFNLVKSVKGMGVNVESNFEQVYGMAKLGELTRLCIWMDAFNNSNNKFNGIRGQGVAEKIHLINPDIPIMVWDGREFDCPAKDYPPAIQCFGKVHPIKNDNELYVDFNDEVYPRPIMEDIIRKFFTGDLSVLDVPIRDCLDMEKKFF